MIELQRKNNNKMGGKDSKTYEYTRETQPFNKQSHWNPQEKYEKYNCKPLEETQRNSNKYSSNSKYCKVDEGYRERYEDTAKETYKVDKDTKYRTVNK